MCMCVCVYVYVVLCRFRCVFKNKPPNDSVEFPSLLFFVLQEFRIQPNIKIAKMRYPVAMISVIQLCYTAARIHTAPSLAIPTVSIRGHNSSSIQMPAFSLGTAFGWGMGSWNETYNGVMQWLSQGGRGIHAARMVI